MIQERWKKNDLWKITETFTWHFRRKASKRFLLTAGGKFLTFLTGWRTYVQDSHSPQHQADEHRRGDSFSTCRIRLWTHRCAPPDAACAWRGCPTPRWRAHRGGSPEGATDADRRDLHRRGPGSMAEDEVNFFKNLDSLDQAAEEPSPPLPLQITFIVIFVLAVIGAAYVEKGVSFFWTLAPNGQRARFASVVQTALQSFWSGPTATPETLEGLYHVM